MTDKLKQALRGLDPANKDHWTANGLPRMDVLEQALGLKSSDIKREQVTAVAPKFSRTNRVIDGVNFDEGKDDDNTGQPTQTVVAPPATPVVAPVVSDAAAEGLPVPDEVELTEEEKLEAGILACQLNRVEIQAKIKALQGEIKELDATEEKLGEELEALKPADDNQSAIQAYIRSQSEQRAQRMAKRNAVLAQVDPAALAAKSPIDQAMAGRKAARGAKRPQVPLKKV